MKVECPVCSGTGMVPGNFGCGTDPKCCKKKCPACCGSGMQEDGCNHNRSCGCKRWYPYNPYTPIWNQPWYSTGTVTYGSSGSATSTQTGVGGQYSYTG